MRTSRQTLEHGLFFERSGSLQKALEAYSAVAATATDPALSVEALRRKSHVLRRQCEWDAALEAARASAQLAIRAELPELFAEALNAEASVYLSRGDFDAAKPLLEQILSVAEDHRILGVALQNLGSIAAMAKEFDKAKRCFLASREHFVRAGYRRGEALALNNGAAIMNDLGEHASALAMAEEAAEAARDVGDFELRALASLNRAQALLAMERYSEAEDLGSQALGFYGVEGDRYRQIGCLRLLGDINRKQGHVAHAIRCYERAIKLAEIVDARVERSLIEARLAEIGGMTAA